MTPEQLETFGNHIRANGELTGMVANNDYQGIATWYSQLASPDFWRFNSAISVGEATENGVQWATDYATIRDAGNIAGMEFLFRNGTYHVEQPNARDALNVVFAGASATKQAILALANEKATEFEKVFAETTTGPGGGDGSASNACAICPVKGSPSWQDVDDALEATAP